MSCQVDKSVLQLAIKGALQGLLIRVWVGESHKGLLYHQNKERPALHENPNTRTRAMYDDTTQNAKKSSLRQRLKVIETDIRSNRFQSS